MKVGDAVEVTVQGGRAWVLGVVAGRRLGAGGTRVLKVCVAAVLMGAWSYMPRVGEVWWAQEDKARRVSVLSGVVAA